ncbi:MAG: flagellar basal body P-ring formation chaperone FlgA [Desulfomonilia bacterium]|jgi:flagella basal body P-ring formation protein FlgA
MKRLLTAVVLIFLLEGDPALAGQDCRVILHEKAFVSGEHIRVGDIARVEGADSREVSAIRIMKTPSGSLGITLSAEFVRNRIAKEYPGPATVEGAASVQVYEKMAELSPKEIESIFRAALMESCPWKGMGEVRIEDVKTPSSFRVPERDRHRIQAKFSPQEDFLGLTSATLTAGSGPSAASCRVSGKVRVLAEVPVARTGIQRGSVIRSEDLEMKRLDISAYPPLAMSSEDCLGMQARSAVRAGRPFLKTGIEQPPLVSRGDPVFIEARCGGLVVRDRGVALKDGSLRESIPVKNMRSGRQVFGTVIAASRVEVML